MSYQQLLSQYADKMNRARAHAEDVNAENREMKANSLEKAFEHITGPIQQGSEGVAALSGAYMAGRKVYKKVLANRAAKASAKQGAKESEEGDSNASSSNAADGEGDGAPSGGGEGGATGGQGADSAAASGEGGIGETTTDAAADAVQARFAALKSRIAGQREASAQQASEAEGTPSENVRAAVRGEDTDQGIFKSNTATDEAPSSSGTQGTGAEAQPAPAQEAPSGTQVSEAPTGEAPTDTLAGTGRTTAADLTTAPGEGASPFSGARSLGQSVVRQGTQAAEEAGGDALSQAQGAISSARTAIQGAGQGIKNGVNAVKGALSSGAEDLGATLGEGAGDLAASQSLDWLGPIGLGIGAIGGLVDLFENLFGKPKTAEEMSGPLQTGTAAGIDVGALKTKAPAQVAV